MAEAHSAVAFSFEITHEGWNVDFDHEVLYLVWESGLRSWKKRIGRFMNSVHNGLYPGHLRSLWVLWGLLAGAHSMGVVVPFNLINNIVKFLPSESTFWQFISCGLSAMTMWLSVVFLMRYILKFLLMYKGWMYESRAPGRTVSLPTKLWGIGVKILSGWNKPKLYSFQGSLPRLPLPNVNETLERYLRSVEPLMDEKKLAQVKELAADFEKNDADRLQRYLKLKSWWSSNYVSDWWEEYVYLRGRSPLLVNSNFYGIDALLMKPTESQAARAAVVIHLCFKFRRLIDRQELEPIMVQGMVPLCSSQYERLFNTIRMPGLESDKIVHYQDSNHISVYHNGKYFKVLIYHRGRLLNPAEIQIQIEQILRDDSYPSENEKMLAVLTAGERSHWANIRRTLFNKGHNRTSLQCIESAAFTVTLDDFPYEYDPNIPEKLNAYGCILLHGKGYDRWFDKSFTLCFGTNGRVGFNSEHSWYDVNGNAKGEVNVKPPSPIRLKWEMSAPEYETAINTSLKIAQGIIEDIDLKILMYKKYGKGFMKKCGISPDAFLQMALQLAYFWDAGKFCLTYEASMTRLYREGRTETVRSCTVESSVWVHAMNDDTVCKEKKIELLKIAAKRHQLSYIDAMCGRGIDRHLFCLYVVSKYLEVESPFLQEVFNEPWRLSTSQTPHGQTSKMNLKQYPNCISAGGGFGPVADDGYGVSYIVAGEDVVFFHISSKVSCPTTNSARLSHYVQQALLKMQELFLNQDTI